MRSVRLVTGAYITAEAMAGEIVLRNSSGHEIARVAKDDTFSKPWHWNDSVKRHGPWGEWAVEQNAAFSHAVQRSKRPDPWKVWANNRAAGMRIRMRQWRPDSQRNSKAVAKDRSAWTWGREWAISQQARIATKRRKACRSQWDVWSETKATNHNRRWTAKSRRSNCLG